MNYGIRNAGGQNSNSFTVGFYASTDTTITTSDYKIGSATYSGLQAGYTFSGADICQFPPNSFNSSPIPSGDYYIGIIVTCSNDGNPANNTGYDADPVTVSLPPSSLSGTVTNSRTGEGIGGATIGLFGADQSTTTDNTSGNYSFQNLTVQTYTLKVTKTGYPDYQASVSVSGDTVHNVSDTPYVTINSLSVSPNPVNPGGRLTITYSLNNSAGSAQTVWLGCSLKENGKTWDQQELIDLDDDISVSVPVGDSTQTRYFDTGANYVLCSYDVRAAIWRTKESGQMVDRYDYKQTDNAVSVLVFATRTINPPFSGAISNHTQEEGSHIWGRRVGSAPSTYAPETGKIKHTSLVGANIAGGTNWYVFDEIQFPITVPRTGYYRITFKGKVNGLIAAGRVGEIGHCVTICLLVAAFMDRDQHRIHCVIHLEMNGRVALSISQLMGH